MSAIGDTSVRQVGVPRLVFGTRYDLRVYRVQLLDSGTAFIKPLVTSTLDVPECLQITDYNISLFGKRYLYHYFKIIGMSHIFIANVIYEYKYFQ